jgi:hypothetical protein
MADQLTRTFVKASDTFVTEFDMHAATDRSAAAAASEIAEVEVYFALDDNGAWGIGLTGEEARENLLLYRDDGTAIRSFSVRVRARKPHVELGPEIDIADRDVEAATVSELPEASRASQHSS